MKTNELRLGNYVSYKEKIYKVTTIHSDNSIRITDENGIEYGCYYINGIKPIEITEEWLVKLGFEIEIGNKHIYSLCAACKEFQIYKYISDIDITSEFKHLNYQDFIIQFYTYDDSDVSFHNFKYIHQLQNLYHSLTGQEL